MMKSKLKLSVLIPVFNEEVYVKRSIENVLNQKTKGWDKEIIVINDGSTDGSLSELKKFGKEIKLISYKKNHGKGYALKQGIKKASGDVLLIQDADLEYDPDDYEKILAKYEDKDVKVVYGSRILGEKEFHNFCANRFFWIGGIVLTKLINFLFGLRITDQPTCYKSWRKGLSGEILDFCRGNGFEFEIEMTACLSKYGIDEVPIHYYPRTVSHGKKIRLKDFFKAVDIAIRSFFRLAKFRNLK